MTDRLLRLGIPLLAFGFVLDAFTIALARGSDVRLFLTIWLRLMGRGHLGSGPLWFVETLLAFCLLYAVWRSVRLPRRNIEAPLPNHFALLAAALGTGAAAFLIRLVFPVGVTVSDLQFGYFASYIVLFAAGVAGARPRWLEHVPVRLARPWLPVSGAALAVMVGSFFVLRSGDYAGGWSGRAAVYAFFEPFFAWGAILGLLRLFQRHLNTPSQLTSFLSARAYTVYIIHPPVLVAAARALVPWQAGPYTKLIAAGCAGCAGSLLVAMLLLAVPGARRILQG